VVAKEVGSRFVVGIAREAKRCGVSVEDYFQRFRNHIANSELSEPLKSDVLASIDYNNFFGFGVIVVSVRPQKEMSYLGEDVFYREGDQTKLADTARKVGNVAGRF
ncbi:MAG: hypothetical protein AAFR93_16350, partial [Pseudomonadota bacterium]